MIEDTPDNSGGAATKKDANEVLRKCLGELEHREIVDLVYADEKSVEEVIGIPENTVKTRLRKNWRNC